MSDLTIGVIKLAAGLLRLRPYDDNPETDEILRQSAIQLRQQRDRIAELEEKWHKCFRANAESIREEERLKVYIAELEAQIEAVKQLPRFNNVNDSYVMEDNELGLWLRYSDVKKALEQGDE